VSFAAITLYVASQREFIVAVISLTTQSGNFWIYPRTVVPGLKLLGSEVGHSPPSSAEVQCA
jgi:hypothetical protein